ncbi:MAG TPA: hypothetical protein VK586_14900 [Streptosporangiaceae bacterium]|nr:hypothetical protein [Streptosporangiaceae bacterium]
MQPETRPKAWIVDIDGTVALRGDRSPYDWSRVGEDKPNEPVLAVVRALIGAGHRIIFVSGRMEECRFATIAWLNRHRIDAVHLHMRPDGDYTPDDKLKCAIYEREIRDFYEITGVIDDRARVVAMWRSLGLTCFAVAEGNF